MTLSARSAKTPADLASAVRERLAALARAHDLTLPDLSTGSLKAQAASLHSLVETIVSPFEDMKARDCRVAIDGPHVMIGVNAVTAVALLLHEFATNAAKCIKDGTAATSFGDLVCHAFGGDAVPAFFIQQAT